MPPEPTLTYALTHYGPLVMGWVVAFIIWQRYSKTIDKTIDDYHNDKLADIEIKVKLEGTISGLKQMIQGMSK